MNRYQMQQRLTDVLPADLRFTASYYSRVSPGAGYASAITLSSVVRREIDKEDALPELKQEQATFLVADRLFGAVVPKVSDKLKDDAGFTWQVFKVAREPLRAVWTLSAFKELPTNSAIN